jgi:mycothiol synthase
MPNSPYTVRNYRASDFDRLVRFFQAEFSDIPFTPRIISGWLAAPGFSPERDLFVAEMENKVVGYMSLGPELDIHRVVLTCRLSAEHRGKGLSGSLLVLAVKRARELGAGFAHADIMENNKAACRSLERYGFRPVRHYHELRLDMSRVDWSEAAKASRGCRHFIPGEEAALAGLQNRSFAEHWGYSPNTAETIAYKINRAHSSPEDVWLDYENGKLAGFCWTEVFVNGEGRILMIGTDPDFRGRGIGKKILFAGLLYLKSKGVKTTSLTVDTENDTALALYESVGFRHNNILITYERAID